MPQISFMFDLLDLVYWLGRHAGSFALPWSRASLVELPLLWVHDVSAAALVRCCTSRRGRQRPRGDPTVRAQWQTVGSQFHWPPLVSGSLQPIMAHGPRFWPRPASATTPPPCSHAATGKPRAHGEALPATAKRFSTRRRSGLRRARNRRLLHLPMQFTP